MNIKSTIYNKINNSFVFLSRTQTTSSVFSAKGYVPVGSILSWISGPFSATGNVGFTSVLSANTYLNPLGYYVCDGNPVNHPKSPIWNAANRCVPNLTDERFLNGTTSVGTSCNGAPTSNLMSQHTHVSTNVTVAGEGSHTHTWGSKWNINNATENGGNYTETTPGVGWGNGVNIDTNYQTFDHGHPINCTANGGPEQTYTWNGDSACSQYVMNVQTWDGVAPAHYHMAPLPTHRHWIATRPTTAGTSHNHSLSGTAGTGTSDATATDNRPKYLRCHMIVRVF